MADFVKDLLESSQKLCDYVNKVFKETKECPLCHAEWFGAHKEECPIFRFAVDYGRVEMSRILGKTYWK